MIILIAVKKPGQVSQILVVLYQVSMYKLSEIQRLSFIFETSSCLK